MMKEHILKNNKKINILCVGNYRKDKFLKIINKIAIFFENKSKFNIYLSNDFKKNNKETKVSKNVIVGEYKKLIKIADIVFSIGGDGTILSTVKNMRIKQIPILGIHIGNLGFLTQCTEDNLTESLKKIESSKFIIEKRILLCLKIDNSKKYYALNDIVVDHGNSGRILKTKLSIKTSNNDKYIHLNNFESDGVIISTPTGSTGYSLSSGGPIIYPDLDLFNVTPISSHSLSARPIVFSSKNIFKIEFFENFIDASITIDGQTRINLNKNNIIYIEKAKYSAKLIAFSSNSYISALKNKLGWSGNFSNNTPN